MLRLTALFASLVLAVGLSGCVEGTAAPGGNPATAAGQSQASAIKIESIRAEYEWIARNRPGWKPVQQALVEDGNRMYDLITITRSKETQQIWFDINSFYGTGFF